MAQTLVVQVSTRVGRRGNDTGIGGRCGSLAAIQAAPRATENERCQGRGHGSSAVALTSMIQLPAEGRRGAREGGGKGIRRVK